MTPRPITLGFDARLAGPAHAGIGRYSEEILKRLIEKKTAGKKTIQWVIFLHKNHGMDWLNGDTLPENVSLSFTEVAHYSLAEQTTWPLQLQRAQLDLLFVPHFNVPLLLTTPTIITIHDLLWHTKTNADATTLTPIMYQVKYGAYRFVSEMAIRRAQAICVPSEHVREELRSITGRKNNVTVTSEGIAEIYRSFAQVPAQPKKKNPYIVYTGSLYPHKNIEVVLKALRDTPDVHLKIASARSVFEERTRQRAAAIGVLKQVEFLGYVSDQDLIELYRGALALIQPSTSEGFGLTGIEAMAVGCAVIASDIPIFHEIYQNFAAFFPPHNAEALSEILHTPEKLQTKRSAAQKHARGFSWDHAAQKTWDVFETVIASLS